MVRGSLPGSFFQPLFRLIIFLAFLLSIAASGGCATVAPADQSADAPDPSAGTRLRQARPEGANALQIWVDDVSDFYALDMELRFDPSKLQVIDSDPNAEGVQIQPGQAPVPDFVAVNSADNQNGVVHYVVTQLGPREGFNGSGLVATITWQGDLDEGRGVSFGPVTLVNQDGQPIEVIAKR